MARTGGHSCSQRGRDTCCLLYGEQRSASVHSGNAQAARRWGRCEPPSSSQGPRLGLERQHVAGPWAGRPARTWRVGPHSRPLGCLRSGHSGRVPALRSRHPFSCVQGFKSSFRTGDAGFFLQGDNSGMFRGPPQEARPGHPRFHKPCSTCPA